MQQLLNSAFSSVHYYIDPGAGSLMIQLAIASFVGGLFMLKVFWGRVKLFFKKLLLNVRK